MTNNPMVCFRDRIAANQAANAQGLNVRDDLKNYSVPELKLHQALHSRPFEVAFLNVEGDLNVSVMIRSASLMGAARAHVIGRRKYDQRGTVGAQNYMPVSRVDALDESRTSFNIDRIFEFFQTNNLSPIFIEQGGEILGSDHTVEKIRHTVRNKMAYPFSTPVIVMGNEASGIPDQLLTYCKMRIATTLVLSIPQRGVIRSFNVSSAFSIACWEFCRAMDWIEK